LLQIALRKSDMKKLIFSILGLLVLSFAGYAQCYNPNWSEPSLDSMLIYVSSASLNGTNLQVGDEIGVFDGDECVGVGVLTVELTGVPIYLVIEVSRDDLLTDPVNGFTPGNIITYRFCSGGEVVNPSVSPTYVTNGPNFAINDSCVVELSAVNTAPTVTSIPDTVATEDLFYSSAITATDIDIGDVLTYSAPFPLPTWLLFDAGTQVLSGTPGNDEVGYHSVTLRVFDGTVNVDTTFTIRVANENDAPTITSIPDTVAFEDVLYSSAITATDIDIGDVLTYSAPFPLPTWVLFDAGTQVLSGTPGNDEVGYHSVTLRVFDGTVNVDTTFTIRVANENDAPTITSIPDTVALEDVLYSSAITAADIDIGDTLIFSAPLPLPTWLLFDAATQVLSGTPTNDEVGFHSVTLRVTDGTVNVDTTFTIRVANENDAPTFTSVPITTGQQGTLYTYTAIAEDIDGDTLVFSAPVLPIWLNFDPVTHVLSGTPDNNHTGDQSVSLMINDGTVDVFQSFVIDVENVNDPPSITSTPVTEARPGVAYEYTVTAEDIDGDALTYEAIALPGWLTFNPSTQLLSATPGEEDIGDQFVTIRVSDGSLYVDHTFVISVSYGNHAPTFTSDPATSVVVGDSYVYTVTANDIDGDPLTYTAPVLPDWLTFYPETHVISGVPRSGDIGRHDVTLSVTDGTVTADQSFPIYVQDENNEPTFTSTPIITAMEGELYVYNVFAEDVDEDDLVFSAPVLPDWLSFDINTQVLHGTPDNDDVGDHNVTLMVSDGQSTETQTFIITVDFNSGLGVDDDFTSDLMLIYPNPSDGIFSIELSEVLESEVILEVLDPLGKVLLQQEFPPYTLIQEEYNLSDRPAGIYFIRVYNASFQNLKKLMLH